MHTVGAIYDLLCNQENLLREYEHYRLPSACQHFYKMGDIDPMKMSNELERFVILV